MPGFPTSFSTVGAWVAAMRRASEELDALPKEPANDLRFAELLLELGHTRRVAPVGALWQEAKAGATEETLAASELLPEPKRWTFLAALASHFAGAEVRADFDRVWPLVIRYGRNAAGAGELPNAALAQCAAYRPEMIVEMFRVFPGNAEAAFQILARTAPAKTVAAVFEEVEKSDLQLTIENSLMRPVAWGGRVELALACLPLIERDITKAHHDGSPYWAKAVHRRDELRQRAVQGLRRARRFEEAMALIEKYEDAREKVGDTAATWVEMGQPLKARDVLIAAEVEPSSIVFHPVCFALGEAGCVEAILEIAEVARRFESRSLAAELVLDGCERAIKHGHADAVSAALSKITPPRNREKLEALIARAGRKGEPKSLRARAAAWVEWTALRMPEAVEKIQEALAEADQKDRAFLLGSLLRAQAKGGLTGEVEKTLAAADEEVGRIKVRARRIDATADIAAAMVSIGRRDRALRLMDVTGETLEMGDRDEMRDLVVRFVDACESLQARDLLADLTQEELHGTGFGMFIEEHLTWQGAQSGEVEKLVARAKKTGDFRDAWESLRVDRKFAEAAAVLRQAPKSRHLAGSAGTLLEEAAEFKKDAVALDILATIEWPVPGEHAQGTPAQILASSYIFRASHGLPGGTTEHLIEVLKSPFDFAELEFLAAAENLARLGKFRSSESDGFSDGEYKIKEHGSWEAARAFVRAMPKEQSAFPAKLLLSLARIAIRYQQPPSEITSTLAECCERLDLFGHDSYEAREILTQLAQLELSGVTVPGLEEKARVLLDFKGWSWEAHRIHLHAVFREWDKALSLLPFISSWKNNGMANAPYDPSYPWRVLHWIPLPQLRSLAPEFAQDLPTAWMFVAAIASRTEPASGMVARLLGRQLRARIRLIELLQQSMMAVHPPRPR